MPCCPLISISFMSPTISISKSSFVNLEILTLANSADSEEITISENCEKIEIINISDYILYLYFQSVTNTPSTIISSGMTFNFEDRFRRFTKIILKASDTIVTNKVFISQLSNYSFIY